MKKYRIVNKTKFTRFCLVVFIIISFVGGMIKVNNSIPTVIYATDCEYYEAKSTAQIVNQVAIEPEIIEEPEPFDYSSLVNEKDVITLGNVLYGEARGLNDTEKSAVIWCILNRLDNGNYGKTIYDVVTAKYQFSGYNANKIYKSEAAKQLLKECEDIARDVLIRYYMEKNGEENIGRTLPSTYLYFIGDGQHNYFSEKWQSKNYWDWSLTSPY